jgi:hypothetical protein
MFDGWGGGTGVVTRGGLVDTPAGLSLRELEPDPFGDLGCGQARVQVLTAVIIACVPTLYHIFAGLNSGLTTTQIPEGIGVPPPHPSNIDRPFFLERSRDRDLKCDWLAPEEDWFGIQTRMMRVIGSLIQARGLRVRGI